MLIPWRPTRNVSRVSLCKFHKRRPGEPYAGCTCSGTYSIEPKPESEWTQEERLMYEAQFKLPAEPHPEPVHGGLDEEG